MSLLSRFAVVTLVAVVSAGSANAVAYDGVEGSEGQPRVTVEPEQIVFDYSVQQEACREYNLGNLAAVPPGTAPPRNMSPDAPARAFYNGRGKTVLPISQAGYDMVRNQYSSAWNMYSSTGDLSSFSFDCRARFFSGANEDPARNSASQWIWSTWAEVGHRVHVFLLNDYRVSEYTDDPLDDNEPADPYRPCAYDPAPDDPLVPEPRSCQELSFVAGDSYTSGDSYFQSSSVPAFRRPYKYNQDPSGFSSCKFGFVGMGFMSNVIQAELPQDSATHYYALVSQHDIPPNTPSCVPSGYPGYTSHWGTCLIRTDDLSNPASWRAWDGSGFNTRFVDPYAEPTEPPEGHVCMPVASNDIRNMTSSLTFNTHLGAYLLVDGGPSTVSYSLSSDLIHWTPRETLVIADPSDCTENMFYPTLIDPAANPASQRFQNVRYKNFQFTGKDPYLYFTNWNNEAVHGGCGGVGPDRDLVRMQIHFP